MQGVRGSNPSASQPHVAPRANPRALLNCPWEFMARASSRLIQRRARVLGGPFGPRRLLSSELAPGWRLERAGERPSWREPRSPTTPRVEGAGRTVLAFPTTSRKRPSTTRLLSRQKLARSCMAGFLGSTACPWRPCGMPRCPPSPGSKGRADRPARQQERGRTMTGPAVSFAGNLTDDPEPLRAAGIHRQPCRQPIATEFHKARRPGSIEHRRRHRWPPHR
jgi:hypothetical protein